MADRFRIVVFSSLPPAQLGHLLRRATADIPEVQLAGVLYETSRPLAASKRIRRFLNLIREPGFLVYVADKYIERLRARGIAIFDVILRAVHCCPTEINGPEPSLDALVAKYQQYGVQFHITQDMHDSFSLEFVRELRPDLGVIYGTRILKPALFSIPRCGSINIHKHKLPEYRGAGAAGLWELRDDKKEARITIHEVLEQVDAGAILGEISYELQPYDSLASAGLKANVLGIDLLLDCIRKLARGQVVAVPQASGGKLYKGFKAHQIHAIERAIRSKQPRYVAQRTRSTAKLMVRSLFLPALWWRNHHRAAQRKFPIVILYHHAIVDRPFPLGMPTEQFHKQIKFLKRHYRIVSLPEGMRLLEQGIVDRPTAVLTFDDGYADNFLGLRAVAELEEVPIALFICTEKVSNQAPFEHDLARNRLGFKALNWEQVRYFDHHGFVIGSHTRTHCDCGSANSRELESEIVGSLEDLGRELGHDVQYFSFPFGLRENISPEATELAAKHYPYIFAAYGGVNYDIDRKPLLRCPHPDSIWELELMLQSILEFYGDPRKNCGRVWLPPARRERVGFRQ